MLRPPRPRSLRQRSDNAHPARPAPQCFTGVALCNNLTLTPLPPRWTPLVLIVPWGGSGVRSTRTPVRTLPHSWQRWGPVPTDHPLLYFDPVEQRLAVSRPAVPPGTPR